MCYVLAIERKKIERLEMVHRKHVLVSSPRLFSLTRSRREHRQAITRVVIQGGHGFSVTGIHVYIDCVNPPLPRTNDGNKIHSYTVAEQQ
jgi:hypothetical protein